MLFEVTPLTAGVPITLRMASAFADASGTQLNGYQWLPLIVQQPTREVTLSNDGVLDVATVSHGTLTFWMSPDFNNEFWSGYEWDGATARAFVGNPGDPFSSYVQTFEGTVSSVARDGINASLELLGPEAALNVPLLALEYQGTGGIEGPTTLKGKLKPRAFGKPQSVEPVLIDGAKWIYQVHGYGAVGSIPKVYEYAQALDPARNKGDAADYSALAALTLVPGEWATCNAQGLFRLGATPRNKISADVVMAGAATVEVIAKALLATAGVPAARIGDFSAFQQTWSLYQTEQVNVGDAVRDCLYQAGGYVIANGAGVWQVGDYFAAKPATAISTDGSAPLVQDAKELNAAAPVYKVKIGFDRCWGVHSDSDVSPALAEVSDANEASAEAAAAAQETADLAAADASAAKLRIAAMEADGVLDRSEKADLIARFAKTTVERLKLLAQGAEFSLVSERAAYGAAYNALSTYLAGLTPAYTDTTQDTPIDRVTFDAVWTAYYSARQDLLAAIATRTAKLADWSLVDGAPTDLSGLDPAAGTKLDGVEDGADVTQNVLDNARFYLATKGNRIGTENRLRFDPLFWTCNFPNTMISSVRKTADDAVQLDAVFYERGHLAGLIWESADTLDHPTTGYDTNRDYRNCKLVCRIQLVGDVQNLSDTNGPILTIEGRSANGSAQTWYVRLGNCVTSGTSTDAVLTIDFNDLPGGFYGTDDVYAGDVDRLFISLVPNSFSEGSTARLPSPVEARMVLSNIAVTGTNAKLVCGLGPGGVHEMRMTNGYDDTYNVAPARIVRNCTLLGYKGEFNHYVGMSHYFRWAWDGGEGRYIAQDTDTPLNEPCRLWHKDLAEQLQAAGMDLILSLSYEMLNSFIPAAWRQLDSVGLPALTGWEPPSSLFSPCNTAGMAYLRKVARQFAGIAASAGLAVHFQVGEPWYWVDFRTYTPYFYDPATKAKYTADTGVSPPTITTMTAAMSAAQIAYLDWLGEQLAASILAILAAVRADHPEMRSYALLYLPQLLNGLTPETHRVNMPRALAFPALDVLQVEE